MHLPIEKWIAERYSSQNITELFNESVICYKNGAYRASLLLSYLGFLTIVKETILSSKSATNFTIGEWNAIRKEVSNHESWEQGVTNALFRGTKAKPIFRLSDDLKEQVEYWRKRRNDAAHFKENEIGSFHTEALWSFIRSNVPKMAVDGGKEGLLNKFEDHFDEDKTAPGSDFTPLVKEIPTSVLTAELPSFFEELPARIDGKLYYTKSDTAKVYNEVFNLSNENAIVALTDYLKDRDRDIKFLSTFPNRLMVMRYTPAQIRTLWKTRLLASDAINPFPIYCEILRNNLIPMAELAGAHLALFNRFNQRSFHKLPESAADIHTLVEKGFYEVVYEEAIVNRELKKFLWVNDKCDMIASMVEHWPLNEKTVTTICVMAESSHPSQWLVRELKELFDNKPTIKNKFGKIVRKLGLSIPSEFK
jgi:hypothetical protein